MDSPNNQDSSKSICSIANLKEEKPQPRADSLSKSQQKKHKKREKWLAVKQTKRLLKSSFD